MVITIGGCRRFIPKNRSSDAGLVFMAQNKLPTMLQQLKLSEFWYVFPILIANAFNPKLIQLKQQCADQLSNIFITNTELYGGECNFN